MAGAWSSALLCSPCGLSCQIHGFLYVRRYSPLRCASIKYLRTGGLSSEHEVMAVFSHNDAHGSASSEAAQIVKSLSNPNTNTRTLDLNTLQRAHWKPKQTGTFHSMISRANQVESAGWCYLFVENHLRSKFLISREILSTYYPDKTCNG